MLRKFNKNNAVRLLTRRVYIHKSFVFNSKNQNSYFGLILKASCNGVADFTLRNTKCSRNTDENIHLVELNALAFTNTDKKNKNKVSTKEQKRKNEFLEAH